MVVVACSWWEMWKKHIIETCHQVIKGLSKCVAIMSAIKELTTWSEVNLHSLYLINLCGSYKDFVCLCVRERILFGYDLWNQTVTFSLAMSEVISITLCWEMEGEHYPDKNG